MYICITPQKNKIMKYVLTGSTGHITKPIAINLVKAGHEVSIITSKQENTEEIEQLGATALVGSVEDSHFLQQAFADADAVYVMIPPKWTVTDWLAYQKEVAHNYNTALQTNHIKKVLVLSSVGAHMINGAGPVDGLAYLEKLLNELTDVQTIFLRPSYFYYNFFSMIPLIKNMGIMGSNISADHKIALTHTNDIADAAIDVLLNDKFNGKQIIYIASDEKTFKEVANVLGNSIGKPDLAWVEFTDEQSLAGMLQSGLSQTLATGYTEMGKAIRSKAMEADYWINKPTQLGKVKLADFANEFAIAFNN
jgi:uncharacterized protein YbjT (DUF2867 family)